MNKPQAVKSKWSWLKNWQFMLAPLLFALYPILFLYSRNTQEVSVDLLVKPMLIAIAITVTLSALLAVILKNRYKAGLATVAFWLFFSFYGVFFVFADKIVPEAVGRHRFLLAFWLGSLLIVFIAIWKLSKAEKKLLQSITLAGVILIGLQIFGLAGQNVATSGSDAYEFLLNPEDKKLDSGRENLPDIYYIMLDSYPRSDTLREYFNYDNSDYDNFLTDRGFFIATKSHSNYNQTGLSVPSTMNMSYVKDLKTWGLPKETLIKLYQRNKTLDYLRAGGYRFINNSNLYWARANVLADFNVNCEKNNEFFNELIAGSVLKPFNIVAKQTRQGLREDANCTIDNIDGHASPLGSRFVFTHILPPHPPYIFGENGEDVSEVNLSLTVEDRWLAKSPYLAQMKYINGRVKEAVDKILSKNKNSIIVIQSDHGTLASATENVALLDDRPIVLKERARNYSAIYLPDYCDKSLLYHSMTNVNTFRVIFNSCFDAEYTILDDRVFYDKSGPGGYKNFRDITDIVKD